MQIVDDQYVSLLATYTEPTVESDGSPITDLASTQVFYSVNGATAIAGPSANASSPNGGGVISFGMNVPAPVDKLTNITGWAVATSQSGKVGSPSQPFAFVVDRTLAPGVPTGFTLA